MKYHKTPIILLALLIVLWGLNYLAGVFDLYYMFNWYDMMMHTLGGVILGLIMVVLLRRTVWFQGLSVRQKVMMVIGFGIVGGIFWEVFEYVQDVYLHTHMQISMGDTLSDIFCDTFGAGIVAIVYRWRGKL